MQQASAEQSEIVALLSRPETHGGQGPVERIDTHISHLFLVGAAGEPAATLAHGRNALNLSAKHPTL